MKSYYSGQKQVIDRIIALKFKPLENVELTSLTLEEAEKNVAILEELQEELNDISQDMEIKKRLAEDGIKIDKEIEKLNQEIEANEKLIQKIEQDSSQLKSDKSSKQSKIDELTQEIDSINQKLDKLRTIKNQSPQPESTESFLEEKSKA